VRALYTDWAKEPSIAEDLKEYMKFQSNVEYEIAVAEDFREVVEESNREVLLIVTKKHCTWCMRFIKTYIGKLFRPSVHNHESFKIVFIDGQMNDLPPEYTITKYPEIFFVHKEPNSYVPIRWDTELYTVQELREFLYDHSHHFLEADADKSVAKRRGLVA